MRYGWSSRGPDDIAPPASRHDRKLIGPVSEAIDLRDVMLSRADASYATIAAELGKCRKHIAKLLPIAWLASDIVKAIAQGTQPATLTAKQLLAMDWAEQRAVLGFARRKT